MLKERIGFIGGGKMAEALAKGIINAGLSSVDKITDESGCIKKQKKML